MKNIEIIHLDLYENLITRSIIIFMLVLTEKGKFILNKGRWKESNVGFRKLDENIKRIRNA